MRYMQLFVISGTLLLSNYLVAQTLPPGFSVNTIGAGWVAPVGATFNKNGTKLFVWEKAGKVYVCNWDSVNQQYTKQTTPVINIATEVGNWRDHGLLGFTLDPDFDNNGLIYLLYVVDRHYLLHFGTPSYSNSTNEYFNATIGRITRYKTALTGNDLLADASTRKILLGDSKSNGIPILYESHGVGTLAFAADGTLIASAGDGASYDNTDTGSRPETYFAQALADSIIRPAENVGALRAQLVNCFNGKILRIDPVTGDGVPSNPFYSSASPSSPQSKVWAMGFRNPFRFTIRPNTGSTNPATGDIGEIYIGDVGWDAYEELDIVDKPGSNCGWPIFEGLTIMKNYANASIDNLDEPNPLFGSNGCTQQYFTFQNLIKQATADNNHAVFNPCNPSEMITATRDIRFFHKIPSLDWKHATDSARVGVFSGNTLTVAQVGSAQSGVTGIPFRGNTASGSCWYTGNMFPPSFKDTYFQADYGGNWLKDINVQFTTQVKKIDEFGSGFAAIVCVVQNPLDGSLVFADIGTADIGRISYGGNQPPVVRMTADKKYGISPLTINFTGDSSFDTDGSIVSYSWDFGDTASVTNTSTLANPAHTFTFPSGPRKYVVKLTVTDNGIPAASTTDSLIISINNTPPTVNITSPIKNSKYELGSDTVYNCTAIVTDAEQSGGQLKYEWQTFLRHNNHQHPEPVDTNKVTTTTISRIGCNGDTYYWTVRLKVTDDAGLSTMDSSSVFPDCVDSLPLDLHLISFSVSAAASSDLVKWATENETNISKFILERSSNGVDFYPISEQIPLGGTGQIQYEFSDNSLPPGDLYYRLRIISLTGGYYFTKIIKVVRDFRSTDKSLLIIPNPVVSGFTLGGYFSKSGQVRIMIKDVSGRQIKAFNETVTTGFNNMLIADLPNLPRGVYFVEVKQDNKISNAKFVKIE